MRVVNNIIEGIEIMEYSNEEVGKWHVEDEKKEIKKNQMESNHSEKLEMVSWGTIKEISKGGTRGKRNNTMEKLMDESGVLDFIRGLKLEGYHVVGANYLNEVHVRPNSGKKTMQEHLGPKN